MLQSWDTPVLPVGVVPKTREMVQNVGAGYISSTPLSRPPLAVNVIKKISQKPHNIAMHRLIIRAVGRSHEDWHPQAIHSYLTRLAPFAKVEMIEVEEGHRGSAKPNEKEGRKREAERLLQSLPRDAYVIALDEQGVNLDSQAFAKKLTDWTEGGKTIVFLIGGSWGLDPSVKEKANTLLSFGKQTLPHLLARITLLEQLYRAETIIAGKTYHK